MTVNYTDWSIDKLKRELVKIEKTIKVLESRDKKAALAELKAVAKKNGFELHELIGGPRSSTNAKTSSTPPKSKVQKKRGKVAPKFKNPADASQTWTGRGRQPHWVQALVKSGRSLDEVRISNPD